MGFHRMLAAAAALTLGLAGPVAAVAGGHSGDQGDSGQHGGGSSDNHGNSGQNSGGGDPSGGVTPISSYGGQGTGGGGASLSSACDITAYPYKCNFGGNITEADLGQVQAAYNAQAGVMPIDLTGYAFTSTYTPDGQVTSGHMVASFAVAYYAVKGGSQFELYRLASPTTAFDWTTDDLNVGSGNHPALSHLVLIGSSASSIADTVRNGVPEPATWTLMILGFGAVGARLRLRRRETA